MLTIIPYPLSFPDIEEADYNIWPRIWLGLLVLPILILGLMAIWYAWICPVTIPK